MVPAVDLQQALPKRTYQEVLEKRGLVGGPQVEAARQQRSLLTMCRVLCRQHTRVDEQLLHIDKAV